MESPTSAIPPGLNTRPADGDPAIDSIAPVAKVQSPFIRSLIAGAVAGTCTDLAFYPVDTIKTRLQSAVGFTAAGGFSGLYKGVGSAFVGAAPGAAAFFVGYDTTHRYLSRVFRENKNHDSTLANGGGIENVGFAATTAAPLIAGSVGELAACTIRVPTEVCKQRTQTGQFKSSAEALKHILFNSHGQGINNSGAQRGYTVIRELYRGWGVTVMREVPFSMIQFPIWEGCKSWWMNRQRTLRLMEQQQSLPSSVHNISTISGKENTKISVIASAIAGVFSGSIAAALTTPLDVIKTRMMLSKTSVSAMTVAREVHQSAGLGGFFAGVGPRVMWIGGGGFVFLGSYQWAMNSMGGRGNSDYDEDEL